MPEKYSDSQVLKWKTHYEQSIRPRFLGTRFLKQRALSLFLMLAMLFFASAFVPTSEDVALNIFSYILMLALILTIAMIDQIVLGWYLFKRTEKGPEVIQ